MRQNSRDLRIQNLPASFVSFGAARSTSVRGGCGRRIATGAPPTSVTSSLVFVFPGLVTVYSLSLFRFTVFAFSLFPFFASSHRFAVRANFFDGSRRMPAANLSDELPILRAFYDLVLWLLPKMGKFPREHRASLGLADRVAVLRNPRKIRLGRNSPANDGNCSNPSTSIWRCCGFRSGW